MVAANSAFKPGQVQRLFARLAQRLLALVEHLHHAVEGLRHVHNVARAG
jgi:hypothetical protein